MTDTRTQAALLLDHLDAYAEGKRRYKAAFDWRRQATEEPGSIVAEAEFEDATDNLDLRRNSLINAMTDLLALLLDRPRSDTGSAVVRTNRFLLADVPRAFSNWASAMDRKQYEQLVQDLHLAALQISDTTADERSIISDALRLSEGQRKEILNQAQWIALLWICGSRCVASSQADLVIDRCVSLLRSRRKLEP